MHVNTRWMRGVVLAVCAATVGCSGDEQVELLPLHDVGGTLTCDGRPMSHAIIIFHPMKKGLVGGSPRATADESGRYQLTTFRADDGAPVGDYRVTIYWPEGGAASEDADPLPPDQLKSAYSDEKTTAIRAAVPCDDGRFDVALSLR